MSDDANFRAKYAEGINKFQQARTRAFWQDAFSLFRGKPVELLSFEDVRTRLRLIDESYKGIQNVPLEKIVGSVGRYRDFNASFLPKNQDLKDRWSRIYAKANGMEGLPPIDLYKIGDVYFVRDGNHRVSVARQLDAKTIEAHVTELPTAIEIRPGMTLEELDAATAYASFLKETGLEELRPHHQSIQLSEPARYHDLLGHIYLHCSVLEKLRNEPVRTEEAAADWYDKVFRPAVTLIRKYNLLEANKDKKTRTEADLYLWMVDHLREARIQQGSRTQTTRFSDALVDYLAEQKISIPEELLQEDDDTVILTKTQVMRKPDFPNNGNGYAH